MRIYFHNGDLVFRPEFEKEERTLSEFLDLLKSAQFKAGGHRMERLHDFYGVTRGNLDDRQSVAATQELAEVQS